MLDKYDLYVNIIRVMEAYQIVLLVLGIILGLYILLFIMDVVFVLMFRKIFIKHNKALEVFLHYKYDNIKKLLTILDKYNVRIGDKYLRMFDEINPDCFSNQESKSCLESRTSLSMLRDELVYLAEQNERLSKHGEIRQAKNNIIEMDANYRSLIAMYNADVLGFNYWISFFPTRFFYRLLKVKSKQIIS